MHNQSQSCTNFPFYISFVFSIVFSYLVCWLAWQWRPAWCLTWENRFSRDPAALIENWGDAGWIGFGSCFRALPATALLRRGWAGGGTVFTTLPADVNSPGRGGAWDLACNRNILQPCPGCQQQQLASKLSKPNDVWRMQDRPICHWGQAGRSVSRAETLARLQHCILLPPPETEMCPVSTCAVREWLLGFSCKHYRSLFSSRPTLIIIRDCSDVRIQTILYYCNVVLPRCKNSARLHSIWLICASNMFQSCFAQNKAVAAEYSGVEEWGLPGENAAYFVHQ